MGIMSLPLAAQDADTDGEGNLMLEEVIVTATRVETTLMKTPVAVSAFDQDALTRSGVNNVKDLANLVPNMDISTINGQSTPIVSMRGVRSTNETELGDPAVGIHLDGVYSPRMQGILALMFDNERVEVLRGPQGTLFGRNSTVGTVNIITAKPDTESFYGSTNVAIGNYNAREITGVLNIPISDTFAISSSCNPM
jgi:iron complex outermembrane receptor protein